MHYFNHLRHAFRVIRNIIVGFLGELKLQNAILPSTYNAIMRNRENICKSIFTMTNIHNLGEIDRAKPNSVFFKLTQNPSNDQTQTHHMAVFGKMDVFVLL